MKDMYSYSRSEEEHQKFYNDTISAYHRVYQRIGLGDDTYLTFASGGAFTQFSHEFQTVTDAGEDTIYLHRTKKIAINKEVLTDEVLAQVGVARDELEEVKASEVGNIFSFGTKKSEQLGLYFSDEDGNNKPVVLGSYGIGITRLMGVLVEHFADEKGLVWPSSVAPYSVYLIDIGQTKEVKDAAEKLYASLTDSGVEVVYDDRDERPGEKFADAELMGIPLRVVVSEKTLAAGGFELKKRQNEKTEIVSSESFQENIAGFLQS